MEYNSQKYGRYWQIAIFILAFIGLIRTCFLAYELYNEHTRFHLDARASVQQQTEEAAVAIGNKLYAIMQSVESFADEITGLPDKGDAPNLLRERFKNDQRLYSLSTAFKPYSFLPTVEYFSPYYERLDGIERYFELENYDEDEVEYSWFNQPMYTEKPIWTEPYYEPKNDVLMTTYSVPFYQSLQDKVQGEDPIGVIPSDIALSTLTQSLKRLKLGMNGYGMIFSDQHNLISHPVFTYVRKGESFESLAQRNEFSFLPKIKDCLDPTSGYLFYNGETMQDDEDFAACIKVPHTNWVLITLMSAERFDMNKDEVRQDYMQAIAWGIATLFLFTIAITKANKLQHLTWRFALLVSLLFAVATASIWVLARSYYTSDIDGAVSIANIAQREAFKESYSEKSNALRYQQPIYIPTGVMIESLEFITAHNLRITGHIWQKYQPEWLGEVEQKVIFPEAISGGELTEEAYRKTLMDGRELIGWRFITELRQPFDYSKYPFDHKNVWLRIWPAQFDSNIVLVPDLESYEQLAPTENPALVKDIVLNEWKLKESQYKYLFHHYNSNFGLEGLQAQGAYPELYYNINIEREFVSPFITALLPLLVIVGLLFAAIIGMPKSSYDDFRNNSTGIIFTILLAHYSIRERLAIADIVYFEYFYFFLYSVITMLLFIAYFYFKEDTKNIFTYDDNKITAVWYWPYITGAMFIMTLATYY